MEVDENLIWSALNNVYLELYKSKIICGIKLGFSKAVLHF